MYTAGSVLKQILWLSTQNRMLPGLECYMYTQPCATTGKKMVCFHILVFNSQYHFDS